MAFCCFNRRQNRESFERLTRHMGDCPHFVCPLPAVKPNPALADIILYCDLKCEGPRCTEECSKTADSKLWIFVKVHKSGNRRASNSQPIVVRGGIQSKDEQLLMFQIGNTLVARLDEIKLELWPWYSNEHSLSLDAYSPGEFREHPIPIAIFPQDVSRDALCLADFEAHRQGFHSLPENYPMRMNVHIPKTPSEVFVVSVDLVGYEPKVKMIEESTGEAAATVDFNSRIRSLIREATALTGEALDSAFIAETGDGAILRFSDVGRAIDFAARLHNSARERNRPRSTPLGNWDFRVGIAFGEVARKANPDGSFLFGGLAISTAVRFQSGTKAASTMIDKKSFDMLGPAKKTGWVEKQIVTKHGEDIRGYVREAYPTDTPSGTVPRTPLPPKDRAALVIRLEGLFPHSRLNRLMLILNMPVEIQPPPNLTHQERVVMFVQWLLSKSGPGLDSLEEEWL